jgi:hypothetical protein
MYSFQNPILTIDLLSSKKHYKVYSMTTKDELTIRTPDFLLSGEATIRLISNCIPDIPDAGNIPYTDIQKLLIGIRIASGMNDLDFFLTCNECHDEERYTMELNEYSNTLSFREWETPLVINNISFTFKPLSYRTYCDFQKLFFTYDKQLYQLSLMEESSMRYEMLSKISKQKQELQHAFNVQCIASIQQVTDPSYITECYYELDSSITNQIAIKLENAYKYCCISDIIIECRKCKNKMLCPVDMDICSIFRNKLILMSEEQIARELSSMEHDCQTLKENILDMIWFMRGSISYEEAMNLSLFERTSINKLITKHIEGSKNSPYPLI